jgi:hypothetical protein
MYGNHGCLSDVQVLLGKSFWLRFEESKLPQFLLAYTSEFEFLTASVTCCPEV